MTFHSVQTSSNIELEIFLIEGIVLGNTMTVSMGVIVT